VDTDLGSSILQLTGFPQPPFEIRNSSPIACETVKQGAHVWKMFFDGASSKDSVVLEWFSFPPLNKS